GERLALPRADRVLVVDETDEAFDVRSAQILVRAGKTPELAEVRVAAAAVPLCEDGEVVIVFGCDLVAEPFEPHPRGGGRKPVVALTERAEQPRVRVGP